MHPENVYAVHLCIDTKNIYGYCTGYLSMPLDTWTHFVNAVIPKVKLPRYVVVTIFRSSVLFLETLPTYCETSHSILRNMTPVIAKHFITDKKHVGYFNNNDVLFLKHVRDAN